MTRFLAVRRWPDAPESDQNSAGALPVHDVPSVPREPAPAARDDLVTGLPLPFVSYGGAAIFSDMIAIGALQTVHRHRSVFS